MRRITKLLVTASMASLLASAVALLADEEAARASFPGVNGSIVFTTLTCNLPEGGVCPDQEIASMRPDGTDRRQLTDNLREDAYPAYSPDGKTIAFTRLRGPAYSHDIFVMGNGGGRVNLTNHAGPEMQPAYSPDGKSIAFTGNDEAIYVMNADGTGMHKITNFPEGDHVEATPAWSPDGTKIAFAGTTYDAEGNGNTDVWTIDADGTNPTPLTDDPKPEYDPAWSPDGTKIAYTSAVGPDAEIFVMDADETNKTNLTDNVGLNEYDPAWSPGGHKIAFVGYISGVGPGDQEIFTIKVDGTGWTNLTNTPDIQEYQPDWGVRPVRQATP